MANKLKQPWLWFAVIPFVIFTVLILSYNAFSKSLPVSYWDEFLWVGRSYFFELFIERDFDNVAWEICEAYDQPKLAEYAYGAWLYPGYLVEKNYRGYTSYAEYLIKNGFSEMNQTHCDAHPELKNTFSSIKYDPTMSGSPKQCVDGYGKAILKPIEIVLRARTMNILLLAGAVLFGYFLALKLGGPILAIIFSFMYGFSTLMINTSLIAHSEALFVFLFNGSLLFMVLYFSNPKRITYLLMFSLFSGLCASTKLTGFMLPLVFFILSNVFVYVFAKNRLKYFLLGLFPIATAILIFMALNPFVYSNPVKNMKFMFDWRGTVVREQTDTYNVKIAYGLPINHRVLLHFFFSDTAENYNGIKPFESLGHSKIYGLILFGLYALGLTGLVKKVSEKDPTAIAVLGAFIIVRVLITSYLVLDWPRYYVPLEYHFAIIQSYGLVLLLKATWILKSRFLKPQAKKIKAATNRNLTLK